jgi:hypothetical protein
MVVTVAYEVSITTIAQCGGMYVSLDAIEPSAFLAGCAKPETYIMNTYTTKAIFLSAFLIVRGAPLDSYSRANGITTIRFPEKHELIPSKMKSTFVQLGRNHTTLD